MLVLWVAAALAWQDKTEAVKPETVLERIRENTKDIKSLRLKVKYDNRRALSETTLDYRAGQALIVQTVNAFMSTGFQFDTYVYTPEGLSYRLVRFSGTGARILYGRTPELYSRELLALGLGRQPEHMLLVAALFPERFLNGASSVTRVTEEGKSYFRILRPAFTWGGGTTTVPAILVEADTGRVARYLEQFDRYDYFHMADAFEGGLPSKVTSGYAVQGTNYQPAFELLRIDGAVADIPAWALRRDLPASGGKDALSIAAASLIPGDSSRAPPDRDAATRGKEALLEYLSKHPQDSVAQEMLLGLGVLLGDRREVEEQLKQISDPAIRIGMALRLEQENAAEAALALLQTADATGPLESVKRRTLLRLSFSAAKTVEELVERVKAANAEVVEAANVLQPFALARMGTIEMEPTLITSKSKEFIEELKAHASIKAIALGLARHFARLNEGKEAARFYEMILGDEPTVTALLSELEAVARTLSDAKPIVECVVARGSRDPGVLASFALLRLEAGDREAASTAVDQILEPETFRGDASKLGPLAEKLFDVDLKDSSRRILERYVKSLGYLNQDQIRIVKKVLGEDRDRLFDVARLVRSNGTYVLNQLGFNNKDILSIVNKRDESGTAGEPDYGIICELVRTRRVSAEAGALLSKAVEKFPEAIDMVEALGDARALEGQWADAAKHFARTAQLMIDGKRPRQQRGYSSSQQIENRPFQPMDSLVIKLAMAFGKSQDVPGGQEWVDKLLKRSGQRANAEESAVAYQLLGDSDRAIQVYRKLFFKNEGRIVSGDPVRLATNFVSLLEKAGRIEEAFFACEHIVNVYIPQRTGVYWNPNSMSELKASHRRLREKLGPDALIKVALAQPSEPLPEQDERDVRSKIVDLGAELPMDRQAAHDDLVARGPKIGYLLKEAIEHTDAEIRMRVRQILTSWGEKELRRRFEQD